MPKREQIEVKSLSIDLANFRNLKQPNESSALHAIASLDPGKFVGILESLADAFEKFLLVRNEILSLNLQQNPLAFSFLLRSMFEIAAKVYLSKNGLPTQTNGKIEKPSLCLL